MNKELTAATQAQNKAVLLEALKQMPIVETACRKANVSRATYYRWRGEDAAFVKSADEALAEGKLKVSDVAESQLLNAIKDQNITAVIYWLKNHHPDYKERLELSGRIEHLHRDLTPEEQALITQACEMSLPEQTNPSDHE